MKVNFHSHTFRCHHADGTQREYVEKAIEGGFSVFGFSDHTPYPFGNGYVSSFRMLPEELEGYVKETLELRAEYRGQIGIRLGLEAEYYPKHFEALLRLIEPYPIEYLLLGQHCTGNEYDGVPSGAPTEDERVLAQYCDEVCEGAATGKFLYLAHPDLIHYTGDEKIYEKYMRRLCRKMKELGMPLEINFLGMASGRNYPDPRFWRIAGEEQADVIFGTDAHHTDRILLPDIEERAEKMIRQFGLHRVTEPRRGWLRPPEESDH